MFKTILLVFYILARLYQVIIGFAMVLTWFPRSSENLFFRFVSAAGDCYLGPFRGLIGLAVCWQQWALGELQVYTLLIN